jgi:GNAT superfamily N-acetyltransferase
MAIEVVPATGELLERILNDTFPIWGEGLDRAAYGKYNRAQLAAPWGSTHIRRVALVENGRLLATAKRYDLTGRIEGGPVRILGLGAVFTPVAERGHGHAATLLRRLMDDAAAEGFGLALLFSDIDPRYYEHLGFRQLPVNQVALSVRPGKHLGTPMIPLRSGDFGDLASLVEMNAAQSAGCRFSLVRDADYIRQAITKKRLLAACGRPGHRTVEFLVVEEGGRAAAYAVLFEVGEFAMITECGDRDPSGGRVGALLQAVLARDPARPLRLRAWWPPDFRPPQVDVVAHEVPPITMMMRPLGPHVWPDPPLEVPHIRWWHADAF